jgi:hypothetical protein
MHEIGGDPSKNGTEVDLEETIKKRGSPFSEGHDRYK